jgi:hypothetical protein
MRIIKDALAAPRTLSIVDQAVVSGCNFLTQIYLARQLVPGDYGRFSLALLAVLFLASFQRALITRPMDILGAAEPPAAFLGRLNALLRFLGLAIPLAVVALAGFALLFFPAAGLFIACAAYLTCFFLQEMTRRYWYALHRLDRAVQSDLLSYGGQLVGLFVVGWFWSIDGARAFLVMAATSLLAFWYDLVVGKVLRQRQSRPVKDVLREHWTMSRWLVLSVFTVWGAGQIYPLFVASLGPVAVATYAACGNITRAINLLVQAVDNYLPARAAVLLRERGILEFRRHLFKTMIG